jgi:heat shock protein HslJ
VIDRAVPSDRRAIRLTCLSIRLIGVGLLLAIGKGAHALADGPDYLQVRSQADSAELVLRVRPSPDSTKLARIPGAADGLRSFGCKGGMSYEQWSRSTAEARAQAAADRWCLVGYRRVIGWLPGRVLAEGGPPDRFDGGGHLASLRGSEWQLVRYSDQGVASPPMILGFRSNGTVTGAGACHRLSGTFAVDRGEIRLRVVATTVNACAPDLVAADQQFLSMLGRASRFVATHLVMSLLDANDSVIGQFRRLDWD